MKKIYYGSQYLFNQDISEVKKSLKNRLISSGPYVIRFEREIRKFLSSKYAFSCNSGTSALFISLMSINLKKGDNIIVPAINFVAVSNIIKFFNANIFLADVDKDSGHMTPESLENVIKLNKLKKVKAIITMHIGGYPIYIDDFYQLKKKYNCLIIEDACHALGAEYLHKKKYIKVGSCKHADISTFSLHPLKTITSGEGGIITTNNKNFADKIQLIRSHGIIRKKNKHWSYDVTSIGFNFRLSDINCALSLSQLKNIKKIIDVRKKIHEKYLKFFKSKEKLITFKQDHKKIKPSFHLINISINFKKFNINKDQFFKKLIKKNIFCQFHYIPIYKFSNFKYLKKNNHFPGAEYYYQNNISIPIHLNLNSRDIKYICYNLHKILSSKIIL